MLSSGKRHMAWIRPPEKQLELLRVTPSILQGCAPWSSGNGAGSG
jgi:hypothetical protein